jgi:hypothetical protein
MYICIGSKDSSQTYSTNTGQSFTVQLPRHIHLEGGWYCGLRELRIVRQNVVSGTFLVCSDICQPSIVHGGEASILRVIGLDASQIRGLVKDRFIFDNCYYFRLSRKDIDSISFVIKDIVDFDNTPVGIESVSCVLHFTKA